MAGQEAENGATDHRCRFFIYGGILGMLAAFLLAPKSGKAIREMFVGKAHEGKETVERGIRRAQETIKGKKGNLEAEVENLLDKAKNLTRREKETIMAAIEAGKAAYGEESPRHE